MFRVAGLGAVDSSSAASPATWTVRWRRSAATSSPPAALLEGQAMTGSAPESADLEPVHSAKSGPPTRRRSR